MSDEGNVVVAVVGITGIAVIGGIIYYVVKTFTDPFKDAVDKAQEVAGQVNKAISDTGNEIKKAAGAAGQSIQDSYDDTASALNDARNQMTNAVKSANQAITTKNPLNIKTAQELLTNAKKASENSGLKAVALTNQITSAINNASGGAKQALMQAAAGAHNMVASASDMTNTISKSIQSLSPW